MSVLKPLWFINRIFGHESEHNLLSPGSPVGVDHACEHIHFAPMGRSYRDRLSVGAGHAREHNCILAIKS